MPTRADSAAAILPRSDRALDRTLALWTAPRRFAGFKRFVERHLPADAVDRAGVEALSADELERLGECLGLDEQHLAQLVAIYLGLPFRLRLETARIDFGLLPRSFCESQSVVPQRTAGGRPRFALGNPFRPALAHTLEVHRIGVEEADFLIVAPREVRRVLSSHRRRRPTPRIELQAAGHSLPFSIQPLEPLHRILFPHTHPGPAVS